MLTNPAIKFITTLKITRGAARRRITPKKSTKFSDRVCTNPSTLKISPGGKRTKECAIPPMKLKMRPLEKSNVTAVMLNKEERVVVA